MFESQSAPDDDLSAEFIDTARVSCPYCGEASELPIDLAGGSVQEYVEDCEICCQPWLVRVEVDGEGYASVAVTTFDNE